MMTPPREPAQLLRAHELFRLLSLLLADDPFNRARHGIAVLDVDRLTQLNLGHGRLAGDGVLASVSDSLARALQRDEQAAHWAGDQYVVLLPGAARRRALERKRELLSHTLFRGARPLPGFSVRAGVATYPFDATTNWDLVEVAAAALRRAKSGGRGRVCAHSTLAAGDELGRWSAKAGAAVGWRR
jgi:diguanylate cyclase (GGDEF)-like protein